MEWTRGRAGSAKADWTLGMSTPEEGFSLPWLTGVLG